MDAAAHTPLGSGIRFRRALTRLHRLLPAPLRNMRLIESIVIGPAVFRFRSWCRLLWIEKLGGRRARSADLALLEVRGWDGQAIHLRPAGSDWEVVHSSLFGEYHRPPGDLARVKTMLDLGCNIGVTSADLAACYPDARITAIELDADNVGLARQNTAKWADRVSVVHGAVWTEDGHISYGGERGEWAYQIVPAMTERTSASVIAEVPAYSMSTLIDRLAGEGSVDYVKMDIEGTEIFLLGQGSDWAERVRCIKVEIHHPFDVEKCSAELERLGFRAVPDPSGIACVVGYR